MSSDCVPMSRVLVFVLFVALLVGCSTVNAEAVRGSGVFIEERRDLTGFSRVDLQAVGNVEVRLADAESVTVSGDDNLVALLETRVQNGWLIISAPRDKSLQPNLPLTIALTVSGLTDITLSGSGTITAFDLNEESLSSTLSGTGTITVTGAADRQSVSLTGSGNYDAIGATGASAVAVVSGTGNVFLNVSDTLEATVSGTGNIMYEGAPSVTRTITGFGSVGPHS